MDGGVGDPNHKHAEPSLPAPPPPPPGAPPIAPPPPAPESNGLRNVTFAVVGLTALLAFTRQIGPEGASYATGAAIGSVAVAALLGWIVGRFHTKAGYIVAMVACGLSLLAVLAETAEKRQTAREIEDALAELDIERNSYEASSAELECMENSGLDLDDILLALSDTGTAGGATQVELLRTAIECAPHALLTDESVANWNTGMATAIPGITTAETRCILEGALGHPNTVDLLLGADPAATLEIVDGCVDPATMAAATGLDGSRSNPGDDPELDRLVERCEQGEPVACDMLWFGSGPGGEYERIANDCGGAGLGAGLACTPGLTDTDGNSYFDTDSPGWAAVVAECRAGDMLSCDFIYLNAELTSEQERVGATCGERRAVHDGRDCVDVHGEVAE